MFVGATATSVTTFRARPAEAHAVLCAVLRRLRAQGVLTTRLGRGAYLCDADAATLVLTLAPPATPQPDTYLLSGTVTGGTTSELTRSLIACVEEIGFTPLETEALRIRLPLVGGLRGFALVIVGRPHTDLVAQVERATELGADAITVLSKDLPGSHPRVEAHLRAVAVVHTPEALAQRVRHVNRPTIVLDNDGELPALLVEAPELTRWLHGVVERDGSITAPLTVPSSRRPPAESRR